MPNTSPATACTERLTAMNHREQPSPSPLDDQEGQEGQLAASALESTRVAIARWTGGIHLPQMLVPGMVRVSPQARWYANAHHGFQEWLSQGGFQQAGESAAPQRALRNTDDENADACID